MHVLDGDCSILYIMHDNLLYIIIYNVYVVLNYNN